MSACPTEFSLNLNSPNFKPLVTLHFFFTGVCFFISEQYLSFKRLRDPSDLGGGCCVCFCFLFGWLGL